MFKPRYPNFFQPKVSRGEGIVNSFPITIIQLHSSFSELLVILVYYVQIWVWVVAKESEVWLQQRDDVINEFGWHLRVIVFGGLPGVIEGVEAARKTRVSRDLPLNVTAIL